MVLGPDGQFMFYSGDKKANWYLSRGLAVRLEDRLIRLTFEPNGPGCQDRYRCQQLIDQCVVCGAIERLTLHHVVPCRYYLHLCRHFVQYHRDGHDRLLLCAICHRIYESRAKCSSEQIEKKFGIPLKGVMDASFSVDELGQFRAMAGVIIEHGHKIPDRRRAELHRRIKAFTTLTGMDVATLAKAKKEDFGYKTHGHLVTEQVIKEGEEDSFVDVAPTFLGYHEAQVLAASLGSAQTRFQN